jgi:phosphoglycolate phosphatase
MTKKTYNTVIWDWNGTLIDDAWLAIEVMNDMLSTRKMKALKLEDYREIFDFPVKDYYAKLGFDFSKESFEIVGSEFINRYDERHYECKLRAKAVQCLDKFKNANLNQYVLSARNHKQLEDEMKFFNITSHFKTFSGLSHNYAHGKVDLGKELIENENILTDKTVLIGDTTHDFEVAQALGIDCILIEGGHHSQRRLKECGVEVLKNLEQLEGFDI